MEDGICMKLVFRTGFAQDKQAAFEKVQSAFSQQVAKTVDPYVPFDTGTLKNSVLQASDFKHGLLIHNTPYARRQYYLHPQGECLHGDGMRAPGRPLRIGGGTHPIWGPQPRNGGRTVRSVSEAAGCGAQQMLGGR